MRRDCIRRGAGVVSLGHISLNLRRDWVALRAARCMSRHPRTWDVALIGFVIYTCRLFRQTSPFSGPHDPMAFPRG